LSDPFQELACRSHSGPDCRLTANVSNFSLKFKIKNLPNAWYRIRGGLPTYVHMHVHSHWITKTCSTRNFFRSLA
jgi:hypothetical protein